MQKTIVTETPDGHRRWCDQAGSEQTKPTIRASRAAQSQDPRARRIGGRFPEVRMHCWIRGSAIAYVYGADYGAARFASDFDAQVVEPLEYERLRRQRRAAAQERLTAAP